MTDTVLILGATGRFGRAAMRAFAEAGWQVRTLTRSHPTPSSPAVTSAHTPWPDSAARPIQQPIDHHVGDVRDAALLDAAADGADVIVHALNPPYGRWESEALPLLDIALSAAERTAATLLLPGNVYAYGGSMPTLLDEATPSAPSEPLGRIRATMEQTLEEASIRGVRSIVLRAGDFIEGKRSGNWFEDHVLGKLDAGRIVYPGPLDRRHAWAWLPDMAAAAVALCAIRHRFAPLEKVGFPGWNLTGRELVAALERVTGQPLQVGAMPWWLLRLVAPFSADLRGVVSMRWLWERPHAIDGGRFTELLPAFRMTDVDTGLAQALQLLRGTASAGESARPQAGVG